MIIQNNHPKKRNTDIHFRLPIRLSFFLPFLILMSACGEQPAGEGAKEKIRPLASDITYARSAKPEDEAVAAIYSRSCGNCHAIAGVNAPLTGHVADWEARVAERGREGLLQSTKFGFRAMPARGLCGNCSDDEFLALIDFMMTPPG